MLEAANQYNNTAARNIKTIALWRLYSGRNEHRRQPKQRWVLELSEPGAPGQRGTMLPHLATIRAATVLHTLLLHNHPTPSLQIHCILQLISSQDTNETNCRADTVLGLTDLRDPLGHAELFIRVSWLKKIHPNWDELSFLRPKYNLTIIIKHTHVDTNTVHVIKK